MKSRKVIIIQSIPRSGSTWLFNILRHLAESNRLAYKSIVSDNPIAPSELTQDTRLMIIKSHVAKKKLLSQFNEAATEIFCTIRDPRDSVASSMRVFKYSFEASAAAVARSAAICLDVSGREGATCFRYEDGFIESDKTIEFLYKKLSLPLECHDILRVKKNVFSRSS